MRSFISIILLLLFSFSTYGHSKRNDNKKHKPNYYRAHHYHRGHKHVPSVFNLKSLNSPVKDGLARFLLELPKNFEIEQIDYKVRNSSEVILKEKDYSLAKLVNGPKGKELQIPVSDFKPGFYKLYVRVKRIEQVKPKKVFSYHYYKNSRHDFTRFVVEKRKDDVSAPDPVKNDATLAGIDSDNDGIRDDVQIWINQTYTNASVKQGVRQTSQALQMSLLNSINKESSNTASRRYLSSGSCLSAIVGIDEKAKIISEIEKRTLNTKDRLYANAKSDAHFSGESITVTGDVDTQKSLCDFPIE